MTENRETSCKARWKTNKDERISDLRKLFTAYQECKEERHSGELGTFPEYGLSFDYVAPETFTDLSEGYWRYQLSWGGPSDEFRFYAGGSGEQNPHRITYVFMDWFDGHERMLVGRDLELMRDIWNFFEEVGTTEATYRRGMED